MEDISFIFCEKFYTLPVLCVFCWSKLDFGNHSKSLLLVDFLKIGICVSWGIFNAQLLHIKLMKGGKRTLAIFQAKRVSFWSRIWFLINIVYLRSKSFLSMKEWPIYMHLKFWFFFHWEASRVWTRELLRTNMKLCTMTYFLAILLIWFLP